MNRRSRLSKFFGPSTLITAAFIGPGTITTCTMAGVATSYRLLWVMLFAIIATVVLQEMSARLGWATQRGLGEALHMQFSRGLLKFFVVFLVIGAILIGNAAYEAGNIAGGVLGLDLIVGEWRLWPILLGGLAFLLLYFGGYRLVERVLIYMVILMSVCFLITAILVKPDLTAILSGFVPQSLGNEEWLLALGLIGTTVVPYNLFLHASTISKKWKQEASLSDVRTENAVAIVLGGIISMMIIITSAATVGTVEEVTGAKDLAIQLEPLFGKSARWFMGVGLLAAGLSSALTAPLAAAYAAQGIFGWPENDKSIRFRMIWAVILLIGVLVAITNLPRVAVIKFAQIANAILLPLIAGYLLYICNAHKVMKSHVNGKLSNTAGTIVVLITVALSVRSILRVAGML